MVDQKEILKPIIVGILNLTSDSFSDGGKFLGCNQALSQAEKLMEDGADIIELGPASTHPDSQAVSAQEEIDRIFPVMKELQNRKIPFALDSFQTQTQLFSLDYNLEFINDVQSFIHPEIYKDFCASLYPKKLVMMFSVQNQARAIRQHTDTISLIDQIIEFFEDRISTLVKSGISRERLVLDPGMGFFLGSNPEASLIVLNNIKKLKDHFKLPIFISVSRKSFIGNISGRKINQREYASLAAEIFSIQLGANYIRTHHPRKILDFLAVWNKLQNTIE